MKVHLTPEQQQAIERLASQNGTTPPTDQVGRCISI